jgi:hypothetical protein
MGAADVRMQIRISASFPFYFDLLFSLVCHSIVEQGIDDEKPPWPMAFLPAIFDSSRRSPKQG